MEFVVLTIMIAIISYIFGILVGRFLMVRFSGRGKFKIVGLDGEEDLYQVSIQLDKNQDLLSKKRIILDKTQF